MRSRMFKDVTDEVVIKKLQVGKNRKHLFNTTRWLPKMLLLPVSIIPQLVQESEKEHLKTRLRSIF